MPPVKRQSMLLPVVDAPHPRDTSTIVIELEQWFAAKPFSYAAQLNKFRYRPGNQTDIDQVISELGDQETAPRTAVHTIGRH